MWERLRESMWIKYKYRRTEVWNNCRFVNLVRRL